MWNLEYAKYKQVQIVNFKRLNFVLGSNNEFQNKSSNSELWSSDSEFHNKSSNNEQLIQR